MTALDLTFLLALEHRGWDSLCRSEGGTFYGDLMTPDGVMVLVNGMVLGRDEVAGSLNHAPPWASYTLSGARVVPVGGDAAALVYRAAATRKGQSEPFTALMSSVYSLAGGQVRLALYQQTTITH
ncbi:nuclear transport factor 2 family protein [Arthrobacter sp. ATA002]|uniref:nuclear transport factor 2 family protein n=1 Tax=Arthrobacter sp. ATA002 TaxID=2991715 RepID=UPI0022A6C8F4|nr:nuclear transport factor 2 family protein [Arthrobacter sp. ATA002]WAP50509.1 nuclear transport factor 2 family protein [Arthrobacter sp. ATA002]